MAEEDGIMHNARVIFDIIRALLADLSEHAGAAAISTNIRVASKTSG
jgi:hypothetical protein